MNLQIQQNNKPFNCDNCEHNKFISHVDHSDAKVYACAKCHELHDAEIQNLSKAPDSHLHLLGFCSHFGGES